MREVELSIAKNYVCNWGLWEAVREILQNAQDSSKDGYTLSISCDKIDPVKELYSLKISNEGPRTLDVSSLVLGNSIKSEGSIGKYGEGYKLALVVLLRLGLDVKIYNGNELWIPEFINSKMFGIPTLNIKISDSDVPNDGISFVIGGITYDQLAMLKRCSLVVAKELGSYLGKTISSDYGEILLDTKFSGKFYVEGLFIQNDDNFKYGYSFNSNVVSLDRDRRAINYYELLDLTTDTLLNQTEDFSIVETSIVSKQKDTSNVEDFYHEASKDFSVGYAKYFMEKHDIDEDTFVGTEKEVRVSGSTKTFVTDKVQAAIVNRGLDKEDEYKSVKNKAAQKDNKDVAWDYYNSSTMKQFIDWLKDNKKRLSRKQIDRYIDLCKNIKPNNFSLIENDVFDSLYLDLNS